MFSVYEEQTEHPHNGQVAYNLSALVPSEDMELLCPIRYIYNYLPIKPNWLETPQLSLSRFCEEEEKKKKEKGKRQDSNSHPVEPRNSITMSPRAANLPLHTGLDTTFRQSRYWKSNERCTEELLKLFAEDERCSGILCSNKQSMSSLAEEQRRCAVMDTYSRFSTYMFPQADASRAPLLAQCIVLIFMFDDLWENASPEIIEETGQYFVSRLRGTSPSTAMDTPLEQRIDAIRRGLLAGDEEQGNGGAEILEYLSNFCHHAEPPRDGFNTVREYLDYRWEDIGNRFTFGCAKFSICSEADQRHPSLRALLGRIGDHISIANDIASYDKEKSRFECGKANSIINLVHVIAECDGLGSNAAKAMAYAWQLLTEEEIRGHLEQLRYRNALGMEEWRFVEACLAAAKGNLFTSVVIARYGGEGARVA